MRPVKINKLGTNFGRQLTFKRIGYQLLGSTPLPWPTPPPEPLHGQACHPRRTQDPLHGQPCLSGRTEGPLHGLACFPGRTEGLLHGQDTPGWPGIPRHPQAPLTGGAALCLDELCGSKCANPAKQSMFSALTAVQVRPPGRLEGPLNGQACSLGRTEGPLHGQACPPDAPKALCTVRLAPPDLCTVRLALLTSRGHPARSGLFSGRTEGPLHGQALPSLSA